MRSWNNNLKVIVMESLDIKNRSAVGRLTSFGLCGYLMVTVSLLYCKYQYV